MTMMRDAGLAAQRTAMMVVSMRVGVLRVIVDDRGVVRHGLVEDERSGWYGSKMLTRSRTEMVTSIEVSVTPEAKREAVCLAEFQVQPYWMEARAPQGRVGQTMAGACLNRKAAEGSHLSNRVAALITRFQAATELLGHIRQRVTSCGFTRD